VRGSNHFVEQLLGGMEGRAGREGPGVGGDFQTDRKKGGGENCKQERIEV